MRAILRKLRADLRSNRVQRAFIVLLLLCATAALTTSLTVEARGGTAWEELYREANGAHAWFYGTDAAVSSVATRPEVRATAGPYPVSAVEVPAVRSPAGRGLPMWLEGVPVTAPEIDRPLVVDGRWPKADGDVVLPRKFAADNGFKTGQSITVQAADGEHQLAVVGIAVFAGHSPYALPVIGWTTTNTVASLPGLRGNFSALGVQLESRGQVRAFRETLGIGPEDRQFMLVEDWNGVRAQNDEATQVMMTFLGIFSLFALISAAFVIANAISGRILARYRDIGLLKALGFTPRQVVAGMLIEQIAFASVAVVAGMALGTATVPLLDEPASREFETHATGFFRPVLSAEIALGVLLLVVVATLIPAWRAGRLAVVQAITQGPNRVSHRSSWLAAISRRLRLPVWTTVGAKDAFDRPVRTWLTIGALTLSVITLTFVATTEWTIERLVSTPALIGEPFELAVEGDDPVAIEQIIKQDPDVQGAFQRGTLAITPEGKDEEVTLAALGPGAEKVDWVIWKGRMFVAPGEAIVGKGFLDLMDADVGDTVELPVMGKTLTLKIVGAYRAAEDGGRWAMTSVETARQQLDGDLKVDGWAIALKNGVDAQAAAERYRRVNTRVEVFDHAADGVSAVRTVLAGLGLMLLLVGLVSLVNTVSTGIRERRRDLGILKAVGFTPRQVVGSVLSGAALLTVVALVVGIPIGVWVSSAISDSIGNSLGWGPGLLEDAPLSWLLAVAPIMAAAVALAALIPAALAARMRANEALRSE